MYKLKRCVHHSNELDDSELAVPASEPGRSIILKVSYGMY